MGLETFEDSKEPRLCQRENPAYHHLLTCKHGLFKRTHRRQRRDPFALQGVILRSAVCFAHLRQHGRMRGAGAPWARAGRSACFVSQAQETHTYTYDSNSANHRVAKDKL